MAVDLKKCWLARRMQRLHRCLPSHPQCAGSGNPQRGDQMDLAGILMRRSFRNMSLKSLGEEYRHKPVLLLCNQCDDPPCVRYCPTRATWKREDGIVMMDFHRCIGCRYCMAGCPYGSRSFNWRDPRPFIKKINLEFPTRTRGVVEKCNFCVERLAPGSHPGLRRGVQGEGA